MIRHAIAVDRSHPKVKRDDERWLTDEGITKMKKAAKGLSTLISEFDHIFTSHYIRAKQTADIIADAYQENIPVIETSDLAPGVDFSSLQSITENFSNASRLAFVGHEPDMSMLISILISGTPDIDVEMKKGAIARIDVDKKVTKGEGKLLWLLQPKILRNLS